MHAVVQVLKWAVQAVVQILQDQQLRILVLEVVILGQPGAGFVDLSWVVRLDFKVL